MMNKKGMEQMWWIIMSAALIMIVVIFILLWFRGSGERAFGSIGKQLGDLDDCDKDKVADFFDQCVCNTGDTKGCPDVDEAQLQLLKARAKSECGC